VPLWPSEQKGKRLRLGSPEKRDISCALPGTSEPEGEAQLDSSVEIAARIEGRLERLGLSAQDTDRRVGLPAGTVAALVAGASVRPRGSALSRLCAALDVEEGFILGLDPGDLVPLHMLEEPQGELGLLAPEEEALLRHYRRLDMSLRTAIGLLVARAAGPDPNFATRCPPSADAGADPSWTPASSWRPPSRWSLTAPAVSNRLSPRRLAEIG
jgi:transcriptional regulator with XRE-family HTH domain